MGDIYYLLVTLGRDGQRLYPNSLCVRFEHNEFETALQEKERKRSLAESLGDARSFVLEKRQVGTGAVIEVL